MNRGALRIIGWSLCLLIPIGLWVLYVASDWAKVKEPGLPPVVPKIDQPAPLTPAASKGTGSILERDFPQQKSAPLSPERATVDRLFDFVLSHLVSALVASLAIAFSFWAWARVAPKLGLYQPDVSLPPRGGDGPTLATAAVVVGAAGGAAVPKPAGECVQGDQIGPTAKTSGDPNDPSKSG
jgi:hypothetical protein